MKPQRSDVARFQVRKCASRPTLTRRISGVKMQAVAEAAPLPEEEQAPPSLLELLLAQHAPSPPPLASRVDGIVVGHIADVDATGAPRVTFAGAPKHGFAARAMTPISKEDRGREV